MVEDNSRHNDCSSDDYQTTKPTGLDRRSYLRLAGTGLLASAAASVPGAATSDEDYDVVLDVVDDLGADNTGREPINGVLEIVDEHDSLKLVFPDGEYLIENGPGGDGFARWDFGTGDEVGRVGKLALVGEDDATLSVSEGGRYNLLTLWGRELAIENFRIDQTTHDTSTGLTAVAEDELLLRDLHFDGKVTGDYVETPHWQDPEYDESEVLDDPFCLVPGLLNESGTGLIENVRAPDGVESHSRKGGVWVNFLHAGDLLFDRCEFSNFSDNAIYGSPPGAGGAIHGDGSVRVENCYFENNNVTAIRLGTPGSYAKNCTVVTEEGEIPSTPWGAITSRAGWIWYGFDGAYENLNVVHDHPNGQGILDHPSHWGSLSVRNSRFELNRDGQSAVRYLSGGDELTVANVSVSGDAAGGAALSAGNTAIDAQNLCITQTGDDRDGVELVGATGSVTESSIDVTGEQIVADDESDVTIRNLHTRGGCQPATTKHPASR